MPTPATAKWPKPKSEDEFEDIAVDFLRLRWRDPHAMRNGRRGQGQNGVDIVGHPSWLNGKTAGGQCKNTDAPTLASVIAAVDEATQFKGGLGEFLFVTSADRDARLQAQVRDHFREKPAPFPVELTFWQEITAEIAGDDDLVAKHWKGFSGAHEARPNVPPLRLPQKPETDSVSASIVYSARTTGMVGRDVEIAALRNFIADRKRAVEWWLWTGTGGAGKSRLALEFALSIEPDWHVGFLEGTSFSAWREWSPTKPTLIVVDYLSSRAEYVSGAILELAGSLKNDSPPVRFLVLERTTQGAWWDTFQRLASNIERFSMESCQFAPPQRVGPLDAAAAWSLFKSVLAIRKLGIQEQARDDILRVIEGVDPQRRPLFVILLAEAFADGGATQTWNPLQVVRDILRREQARWQAVVPTSAIRDKYVALILIATIAGGIEIPDTATDAWIGDHVDVKGLLPTSEELDEGVAAVMMGSECGRHINAMEPDILGELFVLEGLDAEALRTRTATERMLKTAWHINPGSTAGFVFRASIDFFGHRALPTLQTQAAENPAQRAAWSGLMADLVTVAGQGDAWSERIVDEISSLATTFADEPNLRRVLAYALYNRGTALFNQGRSDEAMRAYDRLLEGDPPPYLAGAGRNNRGILFAQADQPSQAIADYSVVISMGELPSEVRASALNNRADEYVRIGEDRKAIADYSAVTTMLDTTPDRRFIAHIRRGGLLEKLGQTTEAVADFSTVVELPGATKRQRSEGRLARADALFSSENSPQVLKDVDWVIRCDQAFERDVAHALVLRSLIGLRQDKTDEIVGDLERVIQIEEASERDWALAAEILAAFDIDEDRTDRLDWLLGEAVRLYEAAGDEEGLNRVRKLGEGRR